MEPDSAVNDIKSSKKKKNNNEEEGNKAIHPGSREADSFSTVDATGPPFEANNICHGPGQYATQDDKGKE